MPKKPFGVLILHGFTASLDCVREIQPPLQALGLPSRMPVLRGHGAASPEALRGVTWQDWVADSETALLDLLTEAEKAIVIGHSMGGLAALDLAIHHADQMDSLVLAAAAVQLASPLAPGKPLSFAAPLLKLVLKKWDLPPVYADPTLAQYNTNYLWAPMDAVVTLLGFSRAIRKQLRSVKTPTLILQSRKDTTVAPDSADIIYKEISTPIGQKHIVWFEKTEHEMFRDCERAAIIEVIKSYVQERVKSESFSL